MLLAISVALALFAGTPPPRTLPLLGGRFTLEVPAESEVLVESKTKTQIRVPLGPVSEMSISAYEFYATSEGDLVQEARAYMKAWGPDSESAFRVEELPLPSGRIRIAVYEAVEKKTGLVLGAFIRLPDKTVVHVPIHSNRNEVQDAWSAQARRILMTARAGTRVLPRGGELRIPVSPETELFLAVPEDFSITPKHDAALGDTAFVYDLHPLLPLGEHPSMGKEIALRIAVAPEKIPLFLAAREFIDKPWNVAPSEVQSETNTILGFEYGWALWQHARRKDEAPKWTRETELPRGTSFVHVAMTYDAESEERLVRLASAWRIRKTPPEKKKKSK